HEQNQVNPMTVYQKHAAADTGIDALYTLDPNEAPAYHLDGAVWSLSPYQGPGEVPVYRCRVSGWQRHYVSINANCEGNIQEGQQGYLMANPVGGTKPLYLDRYPANNTIIVTANPSYHQQLLSAGYQNVSIVGYVF